LQWTKHPYGGDKHRGFHAMDTIPMNTSIRSNGRPNDPAVDIHVLIAESIHMVYYQVPVRDATQDMQ
jgi:hypothetical protein